MKADFEKGTKVCSKCKRELPIEMFSKSKNNIDGLYYYCKDCTKKNYYDNRDKIRVCKRSYYKANREVKQTRNKAM
jgi:hypothetical protein